MYHLSKREKILIYLLAVVVILWGGYQFLLAPAMDRYLVLQQLVAEEKITKNSMEATIMRQTQAQEQLENTRQAVKKASAVYYAPLRGDELNDLINSRLAASGVRCTSINITGIEAVELKYSKAGSEGITFPARDALIGAGESIDTGASDDSEELTGTLLGSGINLQLEGTEANLRAFLDGLAYLAPLRVDRFEFGQKDGGEADFTLQCDITVLMTDQLD